MKYYRAPQLGGEHVGERHELLRFVGGIAEHVALVASADLLQRLGAHAVHTLPDVGGLRLDVHEHLRRRHSTRSVSAIASVAPCFAAPSLCGYRKTQ